jgi:hypothetical protein
LIDFLELDLTVAVRFFPTCFGFGKTFFFSLNFGVLRPLGVSIAGLSFDKRVNLVFPFELISFELLSFLSCF